MLRVENLSCGYDDSMVVKNISFNVKDGQRLCILGPNGCGKTTLLRGIMGMLPINGSVYVDGCNIKSFSARQKGQKIAMLSQMSDTYFSYTVYETVMLGRYAHQKRGVLSSADESDRRAVRESLERVGMLEFKDRQITELSGGQLQRVFLARTFAQTPEVILLDEPTNHLDLKYQVELMNSLKEWVSAGRRCVVGVLHDINLALSFADTVLLMEQGEAKAYCAVENLDLDLVSRIYQLDVGGYMRTALERWK